MKSTKFNQSWKTLLKATAGAILASACTMASAIEFETLKNPVLEYRNWSIKDFAAAKKGDSYFVFFSGFYREDGRLRCHVVEVETKDFQNFSKPILNFYGKEQRWRGMCSPNVTRLSNGQYVLTFNSWGDKGGKKNQLFYKTSWDLRTWSKTMPLASDITEGTRAIDAAIHQNDDGDFYVIWKEKQTPKIAKATSLKGPWKRLGANGGRLTFQTQDGDRSDSYENYQFLNIDGKVKMLATHMKRGHAPVVFELSSGTSDDEESRMTRWVNGSKINVPLQGFNTDDRANAAAILDLKDEQGFYYLFYAGNESSTSSQYSGRGWNRLGLGRSTNLSNWEFLAGGTAPTDKFEVECESNRRMRKECKRVPGLKSSHVTLLKRYSSSPCRAGYSYGVVNSTLWVDKGCRGKFLINKSGK